MAKLTREEVIKKVKKGESLRGAYLQGRPNLRGVNFSGADLGSANLGGVDLGGANLSHANLSRANLSRANLYGADLSHADISHAELNRATLSGTDLRSANLSDAKLIGANLRRALLIGANLSNAYLNRATLIGADLNCADLKNADFSSSNFEDANLSKADITGANIWNIATNDWKIENIICEYVYNWKWKGDLLANYEEIKEDKEKTRRNFATGEFEEIYKSFPKLELIFQEKYKDIDHKMLLSVLNEINRQTPQANLTPRKLEQDINTRVTIQAANKEVLEQAANSISKVYEERIRKYEEERSILIQMLQKEQGNSSDLLQLVRYFAPSNLTENPQRPSGMIINNEYKDCTVLIGDNSHQQIEYNKNTYNITYNMGMSHLNNALNKLDNETDFLDALNKGNKELAEQLKALPQAEQEKIQKELQAELAKKVISEPSFKEKLKKAGTWLAKKGGNVAEQVLVQVLANAISSSTGMPPTPSLPLSGNCSGVIT